MIPLIVMFGLLGVGMVLVAYGTVAKNKWGINRGALSCPRCKTVAPQVRRPNSARQSMWGGWSCSVCGAELDKWGRELPPVAKNQINSTDHSILKDWWNASFTQPGRIPGTLLVVSAVALALNFWFDYYHPRGLLYDPFLLFAMYKGLMKSKNPVSQK